MAEERRTTRQRRTIEDVLRDMGRFVSAQDLHARLRADGADVGLATVYRTLSHMADRHTVDMLRAPDGQAWYRACAAAYHHHHLVCRECGHTVEVSGEAVELWSRQVAAQHGFTDVAHVLELFGTCATCREAQRD